MRLDMKSLECLGEEYSQLVLFTLFDDKDNILKTVIKDIDKAGRYGAIAGSFEALSEFLAENEKDILDDIFEKYDIEVNFDE